MKCGQLKSSVDFIFYNKFFSEVSFIIVIFLIYLLNASQQTILLYPDQIQLKPLTFSKKMILIDNLIIIYQRDHCLPIVRSKIKILLNTFKQQSSQKGIYLLNMSTCELL